MQKKMHPFKCTESKADHEGQKYAFNVRSQNELTRQETSQQVPKQKRLGKEGVPSTAEAGSGTPPRPAQGPGTAQRAGGGQATQRRRFSRTTDTIPTEGRCQQGLRNGFKGSRPEKPSRLGEQCRLRASPGLSSARGRSAGTAGQRTALSRRKCISQM